VVDCNRVVKSAPGSCHRHLRVQGGKVKTFYLAGRHARQFFQAIPVLEFR
jgi:hypothetical protein